MELPPSTKIEAVRGVWRRLFEEDPIGDTDGADVTTLVLWTQAPKTGIYVDIRLPKESPGRSKDAAVASGYQPRPEALQGVGLLTGNSAKNCHLEILSKQKSFAGVLERTLGDTTSGDALTKDTILAQLANNAASSPTSLKLSTCFWRRDIDYQPPTGGLDIGVCASEPENPDGSIDLRETGDDASYAEVWHRLPQSNVGPSFAFKLLSENNIERVGYWVRTGKFFAYAIGRPTDSEKAKALHCHEKSPELKGPTCTGKSLHEAIASIEKDVEYQLLLLGSYIAVAGEIEENTNNGGDGSCCWKILHSTDPGLVGCNLVDDTIGPLSCSTISTTNEYNRENLLEGDTITQIVTGNLQKIRQWKVIELAGPTGLPGIDG
jgi:hypothetical protein